MVPNKNRFVVRKQVKQKFLIIIMAALLTYFVQYWCRSDDSLDFIPEVLRIYVTLPDVDETNTVKADILYQKVQEHNKINKVLNTATFGFVAVDTTIIAVRVHKDIAHLQLLIISLGLVGNIDETLVIFSHSHYDERINRLVESITFCRVLQIFYPHSVQLHPPGLPGVDLRDCNINKNQTFCLDRDEIQVLDKHHWWWTANWIFEHLPWAKGYKGYVVFLQEDNIVAPDSLYILDYLKEAARYYFYDAELLSLGGKNDGRDLYNFIIKEEWRPPYDLGVAFNKTTWRRIKSLGQCYCRFEDYGWSNSLMNVFWNRRAELAKMVAVKAPRVVNLIAGDLMIQARTIYTLWKSDNLFPEVVRTTFSFNQNGKTVQEKVVMTNGSRRWSDPKAVSLCMVVLHGSATTTDSISFNLT